MNIMIIPWSRKPRDENRFREYRKEDLFFCNKCNEWYPYLLYDKGKKISFDNNIDVYDLLNDDEDRGGYTWSCNVCIDKVIYENECITIDTTYAHLYSLYDQILQLSWTELSMHNDRTINWIIIKDNMTMFFDYLNTKKTQSLIFKNFNSKNIINTLYSIKQNNEIDLNDETILTININEDDKIDYRKIEQIKDGLIGGSGKRKALIFNSPSVLLFSKVKPSIFNAITHRINMYEIKCDRLIKIN